MLLMKRILLFVTIYSLFLIMCGTRHVFADKVCQHCVELVKRTHGYRKAVSDATNENPEIITELVQTHPNENLKLFNIFSTP